jgi:hypothetical protein
MPTKAPQSQLAFQVPSYALTNILDNDLFHAMYKDITSHQKIKSLPCLVCGSKEVDVCHVKSRGSGGGDDVWNLMPLCRTHHAEQHQIGILTFVEKYLSVAFYLFENGWVMKERKLVSNKNLRPDSLK